VVVTGGIEMVAYDQSAIVDVGSAGESGSRKVDSREMGVSQQETVS
jgi:hypothetical protein